MMRVDLIETFYSRKSSKFSVKVLGEGPFFIQLFVEEA
jgi:hypothetical protein